MLCCNHVAPNALTFLCLHSECSAVEYYSLFFTCAVWAKNGLNHSGFTLEVVLFGEIQYKNVSSGRIPGVLVVMHIYGFRFTSCYKRSTDNYTVTRTRGDLHTVLEEPLVSGPYVAKHQSFGKREKSSSAHKLKACVWFNSLYNCSHLIYVYTMKWRLPQTEWGKSECGTA